MDLSPTQPGDGFPFLCEPADVIAFVERFLGGQEPITAVLSRSAAWLLALVVEGLERGGVRLVLSAKSDPEAVDYAAQTLGGAAIGAPTGAAIGLAVLGVLGRLGYLVPQVGCYFAAACAVGTLVGAALGFSVTRAGLRVRFVASDPSLLEIRIAQQGT
ncbi:MAG: hypothetical protein KF873_18680 [Gemmataceae bacterium]|nr:hypothetical protein [Gemmataceae bacterium]